MMCTEPLTNFIAVTNLNLELPWQLNNKALSYVGVLTTSNKVGYIAKS